MKILVYNSYQHKHERYSKPFFVDEAMNLLTTAIMENHENVNSSGCYEAITLKAVQTQKNKKRTCCQ